jgi:hypothetical protein
VRVFVEFQEVIDVARTAVAAPMSAINFPFEIGVGGTVAPQVARAAETAAVYVAKALPI